MYEKIREEEVLLKYNNKMETDRQTRSEEFNF